MLESERLRLEALRDNPDLPLVYLDIAIKGNYVGRVKIVLFKNEAPRAAENFRALCTGGWANWLHLSSEACPVVLAAVVCNSCGETGTLALAETPLKPLHVVLCEVHS